MRPTAGPRVGAAQGLPGRRRRGRAAAARRRGIRRLGGPHDGPHPVDGRALVQGPRDRAIAPGARRDVEPVDALRLLAAGAPGVRIERQHARQGEAGRGQRDGPEAAPGRRVGRRAPGVDEGRGGGGSRPPSTPRWRPAPTSTSASRWSTASTTATRRSTSPRATARPRSSPGLPAAGADVNAIEPCFQAVPLHKAVYNGHADITRLLVAHRGIDLDFQGGTTATPACTTRSGTATPTAPTSWSRPAHGSTYAATTARPRSTSRPTSSGRITP